MNELSAPEPADPRWAELVPVLDDAMHALGETDRAAVVLRFFEQRTLQEVGAALHLTKSAAHMRIDRALERLRVLLLRRGVKSTTSGRAAALLVGATASAPAGLAASITTTVIQATATTGATALIAQTARIMATTKLKLGIAGALLATGLVATQALRQSNHEKPRQASLERQIVAQHKAPSSPPAPRMADTIPVGRQEQNPPQPGGELTPPQGLGAGEPKEPAVASRKRMPARPPKGAGSAEPPQTDSQAGARIEQLATAQVARITGDNAATTIRVIQQSGEAAFAVDPRGGLHLMQFRDGDWEETGLPPERHRPKRGSPRCCWTGLRLDRRWQFSLQLRAGKTGGDDSASAPQRQRLTMFHPCGTVSLATSVGGELVST